MPRTVHSTVSLAHVTWCAEFEGYRVLSEATPPLFS